MSLGKKFGVSGPIKVFGLNILFIDGCSNDGINFITFDGLNGSF